MTGVGCRVFGYELWVSLGDSDRSLVVLLLSIINLLDLSILHVNGVTDTSGFGG